MIEALYHSGRGISHGSLSRKRILRPSCIQNEFIGHLIAEGNNRFKSCTMGRHDNVRLHGFNISHCVLYDFRLCINQMKASHDRMDIVTPGDLLCMSDGVDDPGMRTTGKNNQSLAFHIKENSSIDPFSF